MAQKRMFTMKVVDTDAFLDMPLSSQCLYFHLNMRADDDGFLGNPKRVMKLIGASEDDLKILIAKRFLLAFEDGIVVIKHWWMHNTLIKDRYHETAYLEEKESLKVKRNRAYTFSDIGEVDEIACKEESFCYQNVIADLGLDLDIDKGLDLDKTQIGAEQEVPLPAEPLHCNESEKKCNTDTYFPEDAVLDNEFKEYIKYRKKIKKPLTEYAIKLAMSNLNKLSGGDNDKAIQIIRASIINGWSGLYALKEGKENKPKYDWDNL